METKQLNSSDESTGNLVINRSIFALSTNTITIGRNSNNDCVINEPHISRHHAKIEYENDRYVIYDLNSTAGTFVNGKRIEKQVLENGDTILLGKYPMLFICNDVKIIQKQNMDTGPLPSDS